MTKTIKVGEHRGNKRIWLEGQWLNDLGFSPGVMYTIGEFNINRDTDCELGETRWLVLEVEPTGNRKVSGKKGKGVIDLNNKTITRLFGGQSEVTVEQVNEDGTIVQEMDSGSESAYSIWIS